MLTSWWFQPIWKIWVKLNHWIISPRIGVNIKHLFRIHHLVNLRKCTFTILHHPPTRGFPTSAPASRTSFRSSTKDLVNSFPSLTSRISSNEKTNPSDTFHWILIGWEDDLKFNSPRFLGRWSNLTSIFFKWAMKETWLVVWYRGWQTTQLCGDYRINSEIRIPIKQPGFNGK